MKLRTLAFAALAVFGATAQAAITGPTIAYNGHNYTLLNSDDWASSEAYAVSQGGHLVSIDDAAENMIAVDCRHIASQAGNKTLLIIVKDHLGGVPRLNEAIFVIGARAVNGRLNHVKCTCLH